MASGSRHSLAQVIESVYGTTPATPVMKGIRHTGTTVGLSKDALTSEELRADRQIATYRQGADRVGGDISVELSMASFDDIWEAVLLGTWQDAHTVTANTLTFAASGGTITDSGDGFGDFSSGDKLIITGSASNNGRFTVVTATDGVLAVVETLVDEAAGASITVAQATDTLEVGIVRRSFTIERYFSDLLEADKPYHRFRGCEYSSVAATFAPNAIPTLTFSVVGLGQDIAGTAITDATYPPKTTTDVIDTFSGKITEEGVQLCVVTELTFTLENGIEPRFVIGQESCPDPLRPSVGRSNLTGQITAFFENSLLLEKFVNGTASSLEFVIGDGINQYTFTIPRIFYTGGQPDVAGEGDISIVLPFQAVFDPTKATNFKIDKGIV